MGETVTSDLRGQDAAETFFTTAPAAPIAAGGLMLLAGSSVLHSSWSPKTLALTHLGTLGFLVMALVGALYRIVPGASELRPGGCFVARGVHAGLCIGIVTLVGGILSGWSPATFAALAILAVTLLLLFYSVGAALLRRGGEVPPGTCTAVASLLLTVFLGLWMGHWHVGVPFHGDRSLWIQIHLSLGILGWVGGAIGVLSRRELVAMRVVSGSAPTSVRATVSLVQLGVVGVTVVAIMDLTGAFAAEDVRLSVWAAVAAAPAAIAVWGIQPLTSLFAIARRRDAAASDRLVCWQASFVMAFGAAAAALAALSFADPRWNLVFGWSAIWGWSGFFVHGLIREDRISGDGATSDILSRRIPLRAVFGLHATSFVLGVCAIATGDDLLTRLTGITLVLTGAGLVLDRHRAGKTRSAAAPLAQAR